MDDQFIQDMKIKRIPLSEQVYNSIKEGIVSGKWEVGDKLPSEKELAEAFGVNRLTVRGALQKLNILGIVETRVGEGTYVLSFNFRKYINEVAEFTMKPEQESEIRDFRKLVEIECARLAIKRVKDNEPSVQKELSALKKLSEECKIIGYRLNESYKDRSLEKETYIDYVKADLNFHYQICKMSHNALYINSFSVSRDLIHRYMLMMLEEKYNNWISSGKSVDEYLDINKHEDLYNSIKDKNFKKCKEIYLEMINLDWTKVK